MSREMAAANEEVKRIRKEISSMGLDLNEASKKSGDNAKKMDINFKKIADSAKIALAAIAMISTVSIKSFADTEYSVKKVQTISSRSFDSIKTDAYNLSKKYGLTVADVLKSNYDLVSSMGDIEDSGLILNKAAQLATGGFTSLGGGMNALSSVMNAYKMEAKEATRVSDILITIQNNGITTVDELQASMYNVLPTAASLKVSFLDVSAALATMTSNKVPTATATTQLRQALAELAKEGTGADKVFRQIAGKSFQQFIKEGGRLDEAFQMIASSAEKSNISLYDVFSSVEAAGAVLNLTGDNIDKFRKNQEAMANSAGTAEKATTIMSNTFSTEFQRMKTIVKEAGDTIGEQLIPQLKEIQKWLLSIDFKTTFSKENISFIVEAGKAIAVVAAAVWGIDKAIKVATATMAAFQTATAFLPGLLAAISSNPILASILLGGGAGLMLGNMNSLKEAEKAAETMKNINAGTQLTNFVQTPAGKINIDSKNLNDAKNTAKEVTNEIKKINTEGKSIKILSDEQIKKINEVKELIKSFKNINNNTLLEAKLFNMNEIETAELKARELQNILSKAIELKIDPKELNKISEEYKRTKNDIEQMKESLKITNLKKEFENEVKNLEFKFEIFGTDEKERMLDTIRLLETQVNKAISEGLNDRANSIAKELKNIKDQYKEKYDDPLKNKEMFDKNLNHLGQSIYNIADLVGNEFSSVVSTMINGISTITSSLKLMSIDSGSILNGLGNFLGTGTLGNIAGGLGIVGAVGGIVSSVFGGSSKKRKKKNDEQKKLFEENTNALKALGEQLKQNTSILADFALSLLSTISRSPTLHKINGGENVLKTMEKIMLENKNFGQLSFLVKEKKKNWHGKSKSYYKDRVMDEKTLLNILGYDPTATIKDFGLEELKKFRKDLDTLNENVIRQWADSLTSRKIDNIDMSGLEQYKKNVDEFIKQIELLQAEQKELFKNSTLEAFEGINIIDEKQLTEQYKKMFEDLGIDSNKYKEDIKNMVESNQVLVTSMEDVRNSFIDNLINGDKNSFVNSIGSYFNKILKNAAMVVYDTLYSDTDKYFNDTFKKLADKLVQMKEIGNIDFTNFWKDFDFNKILEAQEINSNFQVIIDDLRKQLKAAGISDKIIDSFLPISEAQQRVNELKDMVNNGLSQAMSQALSDNDFNSFEKTLGQSIYNSVKDSLIKAFLESETYKKYIDKYFDFEAFEKELGNITDPKLAFEKLKEYMDKLNSQLEANGMGFQDSTQGNKEEENNKLGNSYFSDKASEININITQHFQGVYGEDAMYKIAKKGTVDALEEVKKAAKGIGEM